ncbi:MAG TPA: Tm-1-like ATP-binding domain-containing protein, partial [Thermomicrobiales bacterium]|nr:Tm-1-like ATP-binding domain-containing protein [Thermomicrobiales bacterium]
MATVVLVGTLDTKGTEYGFLRDRIRESGCEVILVDAGILGDPLITPDVDREAVAAAGGANLAELVAARDRGDAVAAMARGATSIINELFAGGHLHGVMGLGGSGGSSLISQAMQVLPVGVPKLIVSTVASGDTSPYVGAVDITMMYSVVDISGINRISSRILQNAAGAIAGMASSYEKATAQADERPLVGATMFGVTTPAVTTARARLEELGYEVVVFHATGTGGRSMEALVAGGFLAGVLDLTTTELADDLVGGVFSAGPDRLLQAGRSGIPQVVSVGALDMVNFGPKSTVPEQFRTRNLYVHNPNVTLMRTTPDENRRLGEIIAGKLSRATGPTTLFLPLKGVSALDREGQRFHDPEADAALF